MDPYLQFVAGHPLLFALLGTALVALVANEIHGSLTGGKRLNAQEAVRLINDRDPVIVDVRPAADYKRGHLLNAVSMPVAKLDEYLGQLGKDKTRPLLVYCAMGSASSVAVEKLRKGGFLEVYPLSGGINGWLSSNLPVTTR